VAVKLRVDPDSLSRYKASGPGYQTRMQEALRRAAPKAPREATRAVAGMDVERFGYGSTKKTRTAAKKTRETVGKIRETAPEVVGRNAERPTTRHPPPKGKR
jgi:hypothetical protein